MAYIPVDLRIQVEQADRGRCCYSGIALSFDHILPSSKGGATSFENLCLACRSCNEFKSDRVEEGDPLTGRIVPLFHPRQQNWDDHFVWSEDGTRVEGRIGIKRATVLACNSIMQQFVPLVAAGWQVAGIHRTNQGLSKQVALKLTLVNCDR